MSMEIYPHMLLVEGPDDQYVLRELLKRYQISCAIPKRDSIKQGAIVIEGRGGVREVLDTTSIVLDDGDLKRLGIVVDADIDLDARWQSLRKILINAGYDSVPKAPEPEGTVIGQEGKPVVGVWLMPDNTLPGELEHFVDLMIPGDDPLRVRAKECLDAIPETERRFPKQDWIKAYIHTWLAWQKKPGSPFGQAITTRYLDADAPHAQQVIGWIRRLFAL